MTTQEWALGAPADMESRLRAELAGLADMSAARLTKVVKEEVAKVDDAEGQFFSARIRGFASALRIGEALLLIKEDVGHGAFGDWVEANWTKSDRTARDYMKLARNFRDSGLQIGSAADLNDQIGTSVRWGLRLVGPSKVDPAPPEPSLAETTISATDSAPSLDRPCACGSLLSPSDEKECEACACKRVATAEATQAKEDADHGPIVLDVQGENEPGAVETAELWVRVRAFMVRVENAMKAMGSLNDDARALLVDVRAAAKGGAATSMPAALGLVKVSVLFKNADEEITTANGGIGASRAGLERASAATKRLAEVLKRGGIQ